MNQPVSRSLNRPVSVCIKRKGGDHVLDFRSAHVMASPALDGSIDLCDGGDAPPDGEWGFIRLPKAVVEAIVQLHGRISALEADRQALRQAYLNGETVEDVAVVSGAVQVQSVSHDADSQEAAP